MGSTDRNVVVGMSEGLYRLLCQVARKGDMTLAELLIGHACAVELNALAADGDLGSWTELHRAWRETDPGHVPDITVNQLLGDA